MRALVVALLAACSKNEPPAPAVPPEPSASAQAEPAVTFDPNMPSFKCGKISCNVDYYCIERKQGDPSALCSAHQPRKVQNGCTKVADRHWVCETF